MTRTRARRPVRSADPAGPAPTAARPARALPLAAPLLFFALLSALWALLIPVPRVPPDAFSHFNPDEWNHIAVIQYLAAHHALPPYTTGYYESAHPPLYHALGALVYALAAPLAGRENALLILRLLGCAMGTAVIWLCYRTARHLVSKNAAVLAAALVAGIPMWISVASSISNENMAALASAASLAVMVAGLARGFDRRRVALLALWTTVGIGSKYTCLGLLPAGLVALWWSGRRRGRAPSHVLRQMLVVAGASALLMGWWFVRNQIVYGDPLRQAASDAMWRMTQPGYTGFAQRYGISAPRYFAEVAHWGWITFWGKFDAMRFPFPQPIYVALAGVQTAALIGALVWWRRHVLRGRRAAAAGVMGLLAVWVIVVFFRYNWSHFSPQGRFLFPLLLPWGLVTAVGARALLPPRLRGILISLLLLALILLNGYTFALMALHPEPLR